MKRKRGAQERFGTVEVWQSNHLRVGPGSGSLVRGAIAFLAALGRWATTRPDGTIVATVDQDALCDELKIKRRQLVTITAYLRARGLVVTTRLTDPATGHMGVNTYHVPTLTAFREARRRARSRFSSVRHAHSSAHLPNLLQIQVPQGDLGWYQTTVPTDPDPPWSPPTGSPVVIPAAHDPATDAAMAAARAQLPTTRDTFTVMARAAARKAHQ